MSGAATSTPGAAASFLRKSVLVFGSGGTLGGAVAQAFGDAHWRVIGCSNSWSAAPFQEGVEEPTVIAATPDSTATAKAAIAAVREDGIAIHGEPPRVEKRTPLGDTVLAAAAGGGARGAAERGVAMLGRVAAEWPKFEKWHRSARGWRATAAPPHAVVDLTAQSFARAFSLQKQGEDLLEHLQPLLATGPPLHAAICCSGAFDMTPPGSRFFLDEAQRLIKANCWPALLCAHTAAVLQQEQQTPLLLVITGAAAVAQTDNTPSMIAYGCAKSYVHHLVRSLAAAARAAAAGPTPSGVPVAVPPADATETMKHHSKVGSNKTAGPPSSDHDKGSNRGSTPQNENQVSETEALPSLRVVGLLPTILDTPANRESMKDVSESVRSSTWTDVRDVAQELLRWAEDPQAVSNGQFCVVSTHNGKTKFTLV